MVGACQQNSGIFLVRGGGARSRQRARSDQGPGEMPAEGWAETGARFRRSNHRGRQRDVTAANRCWVEADAGGAEAGLGSGRARCRQVPRLGWQRARSEMPAGGKAGLAADRCWVEADAGDVEAGLGAARDRTRCRRRPRLGWQRNLQGPGRRQPNQLKRKCFIISSSNSGFSKSFSLVMIRLLCSQNPASW